ncbi:anthranilate synthase component I [Neobacillus sp. YIM B06451]|uniref:anthranilate synthase component I n=1 Tax=Neobacillus sp. YIM B06451 TaxID=3070994 RepID=UPI00292E82B0|nr:anthranilate synthase component I [Neobacillus sp. YIM B06451]
MVEATRTAVKVQFIEMQGDTLTPVSIFQKLQGTKKFLLESSLNNWDVGRYSFIGARPAFELVSEGTKNRLIIAGEEEMAIEGNPLKIVENLLPPIEADVPFPFFGGAAGYAGYDVIRLYEDIGQVPEGSLGMPDCHFMFFEEAIVYDHLEQKVYIAGVPLLATTSDESLAARLEKRRIELANPLSEVAPAPFTLGTFTGEISKQTFMDKVKAVKRHIEEGDIFQAVLSQRLSSKFSGDSFSCYRRLRTHNPSPYMFYFDFGAYSVMGVSPESLVKIRGRTVYSNPIAGTRPRGKSLEEDLALSDELKHDEKELAEHRMLVDLGRNDLGRICEFGTVQVSKYLQIEKYRHVMHLVSELEGKLRREFSPLDALAACLPAGTVSGAPKIRAMQIINELEGMKRGLYSGAIGYLSAGGQMDFALAIRTMIIKDGQAFIQAGAGIVHDSIPELEYEETIYKLKAFLGGLV